MWISRRCLRKEKLMELEKKNWIEGLKLKEQSKKVRTGLIYSACAAPMLGIAYGLGGYITSKEPYTWAFPTGSLAWAVFYYIFGLVAIVIYSCTQGTSFLDHFRIFKCKISNYALMIGGTGMLADLCFYGSCATVTGALASPLTSLYGFFGAVITSIFYREKILNRWTVIGIVSIVIGLWVCAGGADYVAPEGMSHTALYVGCALGLLSAFFYGTENFAIAAGSDMMPEHSLMFWRAGFALILNTIFGIIFFNMYPEILTAMFQEPTLWVYAGAVGGGWAMQMLIAVYLGINIAGTTGGGVVSSTGMVWAGFLSMTVYGLGFSVSTALGTIVLFGGVAVMLLRPGKTISKIRS